MQGRCKGKVHGLCKQGRKKMFFALFASQTLFEPSEVIPLTFQSEKSTALVIALRVVVGKLLS